MNLIFMRHGEATNNKEKLLSDKEIYWSILTEKGIKEVKDSINILPKSINRIYVSPLPRTIETAHLVYKKYKATEVIIDNRLREINYGKYSGKKNNEELDNIRLKQIDGDYFIKFGDYGENKFKIEFRLSTFLKDISIENSKDSTILIISHGSITSYMKRLLTIKTPHIKTGKIESFTNVDFTSAFTHLDELNKLEKGIKKEKE